MTSSDLEHLITEYLQAVEKGLKLFEQKTGRRDILAAWHEGALSRTGELSDGIEYQFHGVGCWLSLPDCEIDFDFGSKGCSDGFDLWKLSQYFEQKEKNCSAEKKEQLKHAFEELKMCGRIIQKYPQQSSLYFLNQPKNEHKIL